MILFCMHNNCIVFVTYTLTIISFYYLLSLNHNNIHNENECRDLLYILRGEYSCIETVRRLVVNSVRGR